MPRGNSQGGAREPYPDPMRVTLLLLGLLLTAPALAAGYGQFAWGTSLKKVNRALEKQRVKARPAPDAEPVAFERQALTEIRAFDKKAARAAGRKAWRTWRRSKKPKRRMAAVRHWLRIYGLHARIELRFIDRKLYGAVVRVLYDDSQKAQAGQILDLLVEKYGEPTSRAADPDGVRSRLSFNAGDGELTVFTEAAAKKKRGLLRMAWHANNLGAAADRYTEAVRARLVQVMVAKDKAREAMEEAKRQRLKDTLLRHL